MRIEIEADGVRDHAASVESLRSATSEASAAVATTMSAQAFGIMNAPLAALAGVVAMAGRSAIAGLATDLGATGSSLKLLAENAETMDANVDARMKAFR